MRLAAALAALLAGAPRPPSMPVPAVTRLADGLEIVVLRVPDAAWSSMRVVVRAGGASDPPGKGGLAHLVEHLALRGTYEEDGSALEADARRAGARLNAHTTPDLTKFELDAPNDAFAGLAERLLAMVTSPAWERALIERERGIIETEAEYHVFEGLLSLVDLAVFPSPTQTGPLAGTSESRASLDVDDVAQFYATRYAPSAITVVFVGPIRSDEARAVVERAFRIPPVLPGEAPAPPDEAPVVPLQQRVPGGITVTLLGYLLDRTDLGACEPVAALLELRLALALQVGGPMVPGVSVRCHTLRGNPFVVAAVYTTTFDAGDLPNEVAAAFESLPSLPPTAAERAAVNGRLARRERSMLADPELLAERVAALVAFRGDPRPLSDRVGHAPLPDAAALRRFAARSLAKERRILINVSPLHE